ncbi:hypothetical protein Q2941_25985 [Bradyrhizobium sp. UFLA05-153]
MLAQIKSRYFVAGIELTDDVVTRAAPVVMYMRAWSRDRVRDYCKAKGWEVIVVKPHKDRQARSQSAEETGQPAAAPSQGRADEPRAEA